MLLSFTASRRVIIKLRNSAAFEDLLERSTKGLLCNSCSTKKGEKNNNINYYQPCSISKYKQKLKHHFLKNKLFSERLILINDYKNCL